MSPSGVLATWLARGAVVLAGRDARRSRANVRHPAAAQAPTAQPFVLDGLPGTRPCRPRSVAGRGRTFGACCFAGNLRGPGGPGPAQVPPWPRRSTPTLVGTLVPTPATRVPPRRPGAPFPLGMPPRGSGVAAPGGALRAIDASARPRSWRTCGPRRLRRQSQPGLVATQGARAGPGRASVPGALGCTAGVRAAGLSPSRGRRNVAGACPARPGRCVATEPQAPLLRTAGNPTRTGEETSMASDPLTEIPTDSTTSSMRRWATAAVTGALAAAVVLAALAMAATPPAPPPSRRPTPPARSCSATAASPPWAASPAPRWPATSTSTTAARSSVSTPTARASSAPLSRTDGAG
jgi:hypothetical protein